VNSSQGNFSGSFSIEGRKPGHPNWSNQDSTLILEQYEGQKTSHYYVVLDGHGELGHLVSQECVRLFPPLLSLHNEQLKEVFLAIQKTLVEGSLDVRCSGATCVLVHLEGNHLRIANCGDSRCVLGRRSPDGSIMGVPLSSDHKPERPDEKERIQACGGHVGCRHILVNQGRNGAPQRVPVGPTRVWYQNRGDTLGLAMSRSLGDGIVHKFGVSAEPEIIDREIQDGDEYVILGTDGIWDVIDNNQAVTILDNYFKNTDGEASEESGAHWLASHARKRWESLAAMVDDISCIVIRLSKRPLPTSNL